MHTLPLDNGNDIHPDIHMAADQVTVSVVSHGQGALVQALLRDLVHCRAVIINVILTLNIPEELPFEAKNFEFPIRIIRNAAPKGFGANHNAAFRQTKADYFAILNPDIRLQGDPFSELLVALRDRRAGVVAPLILNPFGQREDSARKFPTPFSILGKVMGFRERTDDPVRSGPWQVDWLAGMFLVLTSDTYRMLGGFDECYYLYYEDVDLCWRLRRNRRTALLIPDVTVVHDARRESHRNLRYLSWHILSMLRFFWKRLSCLCAFRTQYR